MIRNDVVADLNEAVVIARFLAAPAIESYSALFRLITPRIVAYFRARGCDLAAAEDLSQEVMLLVYRESRQLRNRELFRPWLFRIARNVLLQDKRRGERRPATVQLTDMEGPARDMLAGVQFEEWMQWLDPEEREPVLLRYVEGLEYHEIAEVLDVPTGTVQSRVFQAKRKLAARFGSPRR